MKYNISRYEKNLTHTGEVSSIFLAVNVSNEEGSTTFEHWCSEEEKVDILKDEANLKPILEKLYAEAEIKLENEIATRPMPTIFPLQEETKKEELEALPKATEIAKKKTAIVAEKLQAIEDSKPKVVPINEELEP